MTLPWRLGEASARHALPHPIAVLCDRLRTHDDASRLSAVLALAEGIARYLLGRSAGGDAAPRGHGTPTDRWISNKLQLTMTCVGRWPDSATAVTPLRSRARFAVSS
jgi:hypothetical protein